MIATSLSLHQSLEQARARAAWEFVHDVKTKHKEKFDDYTSTVKKLPAMINNNGLGQVAAFLFSKKKESNAQELLLRHLELWLTSSEKNQGLPYYSPPYENSNKLLEGIRQGGSATYIRATLEALAFVDYLRRFAAGLSEDDRSGGEKRP